MSKFLEQSAIDSLINQAQNTNVRIIIEKNCGYKFMIFLNNDALLSDLYREVELVYGYLNVPLNLYYGVNYIRDSNSAVNIVNNEVKTESSKSDDNINRCRKCVERTCYDCGEKKFIPKNNKKFKEYVNEINLEPCTKLPCKVCYILYLDVCEKH